jgi:AraC family transcriptional regulator
LRGGSSRRWRDIAQRVATTDVSVTTLAAEERMHPVALARAFRRHLGCSLTAYRRRARIRRAVELLSSTRMPLADVAMESGFTDQSHLCRIFRSDVGVTPAFFRSATV